MGKFHEDLTYAELEQKEIPCPVCEEVDLLVANLLESSRYTYDPDGYERSYTNNIIGLLGLTCWSCGFELIKRTPREAIYIEETYHRDRSKG